jgi:beta-N-acetylglucosaminidase
MTGKIINTIKNNKQTGVAILIGALMASYIGYNSYMDYQHYQEQKLMFQQQQEQMEKFNQQMEDMHTEMNQISKEVQVQQSEIEKTTGRLTEKHMTNEHEITNRGSGASPYSFIVKSQSTVTAYELNQAFEGTGLEGLGEAFVSAELNTGVNAVFLAGLAANESSWGHSYLANAKNNLFGFQAYDNDPTRSARSFSSKAECIAYVAQFLSEHYCDESGSYYRGGTIAAINTVYATDGNWKNNVYSIMRTIERKAIDC